MIAEPLSRALEATGYLAGGSSAAPSVTLLDQPPSEQLPGVWMPSFQPDALWRSNSEPRAWGASATDLTVYFKFVENPAEARPAEWQQEIWNRGFSPLLWIVCPDRIELYDGFGEPRRAAETYENLLGTFSFVDAELTRLDELAGRLAMETGRFWQRSPVSRSTGVDQRLLHDLAHLERDLVTSELRREEAQGLIGRSIFAKYLIDREIVTPEEMQEICGHDDLVAALRDHAAAERFFDWTRRTFNGDLFPRTSSLPVAKHLDRVARFLTAEDPETGQTSLFPYQFDVIPVELISAIYEQFVHSAAADTAHGGQISPVAHEDVYYTPLAAVSLVLDEVLHDADGSESVLDLTCGSGVFLVEALRRLVYSRSGGPPTREQIEQVLYNQIVGVDTSDAAIRVAAFSLYLAALELDSALGPPSELKFKPLIGSTLLIGDARRVDETKLGKPVLTTRSGRRRFDIIVGNPPWSFRGRDATASRRNDGSSTPIQPRGQSLDFINRALDFAHGETRFGMILSAMPFFGRSSTSVSAAQHVVEALGRVTLVNLAELATWLFPKANLPAVALLARHREQRRDWMTLVHAPWSPTGERTHTIEIAPTNVATLPVASWRRNEGLLKASFVGCLNDLLLLDRLADEHSSLGHRLASIEASFRTGLIFGNRSKDASFLQGMPILRAGDMRLFSSLDDLPLFDGRAAQWPRDRAIYAAPLLLVKEFLVGGPRAVVTVAEQDAIFTGACFGVSFAATDLRFAYLVGGILASSLAAWYFLMTGSTFGIWVPRLMQADVRALPLPDIETAIKSGEGKQVVELVESFQGAAPSEQSLATLDDAVAELYGLRAAERMIVADGLRRGTWQWQAGRLASVAPASIADLERYAAAFLQTMDSWFSVLGRRRMRAEIFDLAAGASLRIVRFAIEDIPGPSVIQTVTPDGTLRALLARIGERSRVQLGPELVGTRDLHVHTPEAVSIIKPAARRYWLEVCGLEDADTVVKHSVTGTGRA